jgi:glycosyltransferase involved in cell wall biosynthesis
MTIQIGTAAEKELGRPPKVSIVIPCYNTANYVAEALDSVFAQTFTDFEVLVVNDGSPDTPALDAVLERYMSRIRYIVQPNGGPSAARNTALRVASGEYVAFLDSDDYWHPNYLEVLTGELDRDPHTAVVFPDATIVGDVQHAGTTTNSRSRGPKEITFAALLDQRCYVFVGVLARRNAIMAVGMLDEDLRCSEDYDLWLRMLRAGHRIRGVNVMLAYYRKRGDSATANSMRMLDHYLRVLAKVSATMDLSAEELEIVERQTRLTTGRKHLVNARAEFFTRNFVNARAEVRRANAYIGSNKLRIIDVMLEIAPNWLVALYNLRDRYLYRMSTQYRS